MFKSTSKTHLGLGRKAAGRILPAVVAAGVVCAGAVGALAVAVPSADAATSISFCFKWSTGAPYAKEPVYQENYSTGAILATGKTAANGCATWATPSTTNIIVQAYVALQDGPGYALYSGYTGYYATPGGGQASLGTGIVSYFNYVG
jgi:hypothetical protein